MTFTYNLGDRVRIVVSAEVGEVIGRAEYATGSNMYFLRYCCADGRAVEQWWAEEAVSL